VTPPTVLAALEGRSARIGSPPAGRSVTSSSGRTGASVAWRRRNRGASTAKATSISVVAKWLPRQVRGPPPKGNQV